MCPVPGTLLAALNESSHFDPHLRLTDKCMKKVVRDTLSKFSPADMNVGLPDLKHLLSTKHRACISQQQEVKPKEGLVVRL